LQTSEFPLEIPRSQNRNFQYKTTLANIKMKYLPFENITYKSNLNSEEIIKKIDEIIEPKKAFSVSGIFGNNKNNKPYEGNIVGNSFNITRLISYRNSFLPKIKGIIEKDYDGTKVNIKMRMNTFVIIFMFIWFGGVGIGCLAVLTSGFKFGNQNFEPMTLIPFGMLIFGYALVTGGFKYESIKSKKYLAELFEAEIEK
jgi:hypothetical protein